MLTRISTNFMSESVTISGDTRGKYIGDFMHRYKGREEYFFGLLYQDIDSGVGGRECYFLLFLSVGFIYLTCIIIFCFVLTCNLIAFEPFFHFCKLKVKIIKKMRAERKTVVQCHERYLQATKQKCNVVSSKH